MRSPWGQPYHQCTVYRVTTGSTQGSVLDRVPAGGVRVAAGEALDRYCTLQYIMVESPNHSDKNEPLACCSFGIVAQHRHQQQMQARQQRLRVPVIAPVDATSRFWGGTCTHPSSVSHVKVLFRARSYISPIMGLPKMQYLDLLQATGVHCSEEKTN